MADTDVLAFLDGLSESARSADRRWRAAVTAEPTTPDDPAAWSVLPESPITVSAQLSSPSNQATTAALTIYEVDRELRRAVQIVNSGYRVEVPRMTVAQSFRPLSVRYGGLEVSEATAGSLEVVFAAFGAVAQGLMSQPVQLVLTLKELLGWVGHFAVWVRKPGSRQAQLVDTTDEVSLEIGTRGFVVAAPQGTRLVFEHRAADGTETRIEVER